MLPPIFPNKKQKLAWALKKHISYYVKEEKEDQLIRSGDSLAFLSYVQIPKANRTPRETKKNHKAWPEKLAEDLAEVLIHKGITKVWLDKMKYADIVTLSAASGQRPYAVDNGLVVVRGAYGRRYHSYHFVSSCGSYLEVFVQSVMERGEQFSALRWTASSRLWPPAEMAAGILHGRVTATKGTYSACMLLLTILDRAIEQLHSADSIEKDMGFSFLRRRVKCKACGNKNTVPDVVD